MPYYVRPATYKRDSGSQSRWAGNPSEARWRRQLLITLTVTHNRCLEAPGLTTYAKYGRRSHKMKQTQNTRVVSGGRRGGSVLAGERKGSGSHSGEWRVSGVLSIINLKARFYASCSPVTILPPWMTTGSAQDALSQNSPSSTRTQYTTIPPIMNRWKLANH